MLPHQMPEPLTQLLVFKLHPLCGLWNEFFPYIQKVGTSPGSLALFFPNEEAYTLFLNMFTCLTWLAGTQAPLSLG